METQFSFLEVLSPTILPSHYPTELPKVSSLQHTITLTQRAGHCRAEAHPQGYLSAWGFPIPVQQA